MSKGSFTPRMIAVRIPNTITILASTPNSNNFLFIINAGCYYVIYCFKCTSSLNSLNSHWPSMFLLFTTWKTLFRK